MNTQPATSKLEIIKFLFKMVVATAFLAYFLAESAYAQSVPAFGCAMRPGYMVCTQGGCEPVPAVCYPTDMDNACPDDLTNNKCYAVENQNTCQQFGSSQCSSAGPFQCVEVPCNNSNSPTFSCSWTSVGNSYMCISETNPNACPDDNTSGICYEKDNAQCSFADRNSCNSSTSNPCVQVTCENTIAPTATPPPENTAESTPTLEPGKPRYTPTLEPGKPKTTPDYSKPYSSGLRWPPIPTPPDYYAPDYPHPDDKEHLGTPGEIERAIPKPYKSCSSTSDTEFHSLRPYQASPCYEAEADIAKICANKLTLKGDYKFESGDCKCSCGGCSCSGSGGGSGCSCHCDCEKRVSLQAYVDVLDAELPIMGNTEDKIINSQDQPLPEGIDHFAKVNEYVSWYLSGVNQRAEYGTPDMENPATTNYIVDFSGPVKKLLSWENMAFERNQQIERAGQGGSAVFDQGGRHDQIVACQSEPGVAAACYTEGGQKLRVSDFEKAPLRSDYDSNEDYQEALSEWKEVEQNRLFQFIPLTSTEDRLGHLDGNGTVTATGGQVSNEDVNVDEADLHYPHLEESRENADLLQRTYVSNYFLKDDKNGDGIPDIDTEKFKHVIPTPAQEIPCDLIRVRTNPGDTLNPTELDVTASFTVSTSCEVPGDAQCDCDEDPETGEEDCTCSCTAGANTCPGGEATVTVNLHNKVPLASENFNRLVGSPYSPVQRLFPKIESGAPIQGFYDMPAYSLVNYYTGQGQGLELTNVENPGGFPMPPKLFYPHIASIHQYFLNCIQTAVRPEGYGYYCPQGEINTEDYLEENPPNYPIEPGDIVPPWPVPIPPDIKTVPYPAVPPVPVSASCHTICGYPIEDLAATVFAESSNGAQTAETQRIIAQVMYNRACSDGDAEPYTAANTIMYQNMYSQSGGTYPPPTQNQITNTRLALQQCLLNPSACPLQSVRFQQTLSIMAEVCAGRQNSQADPTNGSLFFSHQSDLSRPGMSFNSCEDLRNWLLQGHYGYVGPSTPDQRWVPGSTTEVYQFGCYVLITGSNCAADASCN